MIKRAPNTCDDMFVLVVSAVYNDCGIDGTAALSALYKRPIRRITNNMTWGKVN